MSPSDQIDLFSLPTPPAPPAADGNADAAKREKLLEVHARLCREYGCPVAHWGELDPLSELISALLSHRTRNRESGAAFAELRRRFPDGWTAVRDAPTTEVEDAIRAANWPEQKAPRIQDLLRRITARRDGDLSLDFLGEMTPAAARTWLQDKMPGVGPKTSAAVLSFSRLRMRALPVDSHHHRVAQRLGLIPLSLDVGPAHAVLEAMLPAEWDAQAVFDNHELLMFHGQRCCFFRRPECERCTLLDLCPTGQAQGPTGQAQGAAGTEKSSRRGAETQRKKGKAKEEA